MAKRGKGRGPPRGKRRGQTQKGLEDDVRAFASAKGPSADFLRMKRLRDERDEVSAARKKLGPRQLKALNGMVEDMSGDFSNPREMALDALFVDKKRGRGQMAREARFTATNRMEMMRHQSRKMPIEFVKAKEVYDPDRSVREKQQNENAHDTKLEDVAKNPVEEVLETQEHVEVIQEGESDVESDEEEVQMPDIMSESESDDSELQGETPTEPTMMFSRLNVKERQQLLFVDDNNSEEFELSVEEDEDDDNEDDDDIPAEYEAPKFVTSESDSDSENEFTMGKFVGKMKTDTLGNHYIDLPLGGKQWAQEEVMFDYNDENEDWTTEDVERHVHSKLAGTKPKPSRVEPDAVAEETPEFGFSEEDYVSFDITAVKVDNIRVSASGSQYHVYAPMLLGVDDFQWLSEDDVAMFLVENGLPDSRVGAFLKHATKHLLPPEASESEEEEIYYDEEAQLASDSDDESSELDEDLMEGMEDLLKMHQTSQAFGRTKDPLDVHTRSISAKGKRTANKDTFELEFNIDTPIDPALKKYMEDMYLRRKMNKKIHREERDEARRTDSYLLNKYPYGIDMDEAVDEFKSFFKDPVAETLRFPPLDFHAHMVLRGIADAFHFSSRKTGKGKKEYLQVRKTVSRVPREPNWAQIDKLRKRRKLCFRMDTKLSKEEMRLFTRVRNGDTSSWKSMPKGSKGSKGSKAQFGYREGEVVGANAREVSRESIGHRLLQQMGWNEGDALGVDGNKGIVEPIRVVVKTTKRGIQ